VHALAEEAAERARKHGAYLVDLEEHVVAEGEEREDPWASARKRMRHVEVESARLPTE